MKSFAEKVFVTAMTRTWLAAPLIALLFVAMGWSLWTIVDTQRVLDPYDVVASLSRVPEKPLEAELQVFADFHMEDILTPGQDFILRDEFGEPGAQSETVRLRARVIRFEGSRDEGVAKVDVFRVRLLPEEPGEAFQPGPILERLDQEGFRQATVEVRGMKLWQAALTKVQFQQVDL